MEWAPLFEGIGEIVQYRFNDNGRLEIRILMDAQEGAIDTFQFDAMTSSSLLEIYNSSEEAFVKQIESFVAARLGFWNLSTISVGSSHFVRSWPGSDMSLVHKAQRLVREIESRALTLSQSMFKKYHGHHRDLVRTVPD